MEKGRRRFEDQFELLSSKLEELGAKAEQAIEAAIKALIDRDSVAASRVIEGDGGVDALELEIDEMCVDLLGLQQPLAKDLRFLTTVMKVTPDLERVADHAVNISERVLELNAEPPWPLGDIPEMSRLARNMVRGAMEAMTRRDGDLARATHRLDDRIDRLMERTFGQLMRLMIDDPQAISRAMRLVFIAKSLERIGDQATNICEQVVFMTEARVVKHPGVDPAAGRN